MSRRRPNKQAASANVLVIGAGQVGCAIAERLVHEKHTVVVVDTDPGKLEDLSRRLDIGSVPGTGCSPVILRRAGVERAGLVIAVTDSDEVNLLACLVAGALAPEAVRVARVRDPEYHEDPELFRTAPFLIDQIMNPEEEAARRLTRALLVPGALDVIDLAGDDLQLVCTRVEPHAPVAGRTLVEIDPGPSAPMRVACLDRRGVIRIPGGQDRIEAGDIAYVVCRPSDTATILAMAGRSVEPVRQVLLSGGGDLSVYLSRLLVGAGISVKLMVAREADARRSAELLPEVLVVHGDATVPEQIREEGVADMDAFVACSPSDEQNVAAALLARSLGTRLVLLATANATFEHLAATIGLDAATSPQSAVVASVLRFVRRGRVELAQSLWSRDTELEEIEAFGGSRLVGRPLKDVGFPKGAICLAIAHDGSTELATGASVIQPGDHVVVMGPRVALAHVERTLASRSRWLLR
ncbi:MAG: Trk system potassium transporter TrkA [Deltaproteobacteria bacterium]|nr:Trk system potassium transporter TrkA [Deltaproteobacteria bacterium]